MAAPPAAAIAAAFSLASFASCARTNTLCQTSNQRSCCAVGNFPGLLKLRVSISLSLARSTFMTSMVFQSGTANRARFPSSTNTPAYMSARTSPQSSAIAKGSAAVVSWAL